MKQDNFTFMLALIMIAIVVIGGVSIYFINPYNYDADAIVDTNSAEYSIDVSNPVEYNILVLDNFGIPPTESLIICSDGSNYSERFKTQLNIRGFNDVEIVDPANLPEVMMGDPSGRAILIPQGPFPEEIYSGAASDPVFDWLAAGGSIYWFGYLPENGYKVNDSTIVDADVYLSPFGLAPENFCTVPNGNVSRSDELCTQLRFRGSDVMYGLSTSIGKPISYVSESGYSAITVMKVLNGTMIVLGGGQSNENLADLAQVISSGITYGTVSIGFDSGIVKNTIRDSILYSSSGKENVSVYIHIGGYYTVYGKRF